MSALVKRLFRTPHARIENFIAVVRAVIRQENNNRVVPQTLLDEHLLELAHVFIDVGDQTYLTRWPLSLIVPRYVPGSCELLMHSDDASPNGQLLGDCRRRAIPRSGSG